MKNYLILPMSQSWVLPLALLLGGLGTTFSVQAQDLPEPTLSEPLITTPQAAPPAPPVAPTQAPTQISAPTYDPLSDYVLGPGDAISIVVFGYDEYSVDKIVEPNGTIALPVMGAMVVAGKTPATVQQELTSRLNYYLVDPAVTVTIAALRPVFVTVSGEVQRPGPIQLRNPNAQDTNNNNSVQPGLPTLSTALVEAGGVTSHADIRQVRLRRSLPGGEEKIFTINLWDDLWSEAAADNPQLQDGDTIFVPRLVAGADVDPRLVARSTLAPETVRVRVVGEVTQPGEVTVPPNSSLSSAVAIAGGPTEDAQLGRTAFIRLNAEGEVEQQEIDLTNLTDNYQVQDGDVIIVPKRNSASILDYASRLLLPISLFFNIFQ
jgi:polysaccharide export outer membrane protein